MKQIMFIIFTAAALVGCQTRITAEKHPEQVLPIQKVVQVNGQDLVITDHYQIASGGWYATARSPLYATEALDGLELGVYTNELCAVEVYSNEVDGAVWRYRLPFKPKETVSSYNARLPRPPMTNGIPAKLAAARLRRYEEQTMTSNITVNVEANLPPVIEPEDTPTEDEEPPPALDNEPWPNNVEEGSGTVSNLVEFVDGINFSENNEYNAEL